MKNKDIEEKNEEMTEEETQETQETQDAPEESETQTEQSANDSPEADSKNSQNSQGQGQQSEEEMHVSFSDQQQTASEEQGEEESEQEAVEEEPKKPMSKTAAVIIAIIITAVLSVFCTMALLGQFPQIYNIYNKSTNVTGRTIKTIAEKNGVTPVKLLRQYGLPLDMPEDTNETSASYYMTIGDVAKMNKLSVSWIKEQLSLGEEVTDEAIWGKIEDGLTLGQYIGKDDFEAFKKEYGLDDSVKPETKFKTVRGKIYKAMQKAQAGEPKKDFNIVVKYSIFYNKYNDLYIDTNGMALSDVIAESGEDLQTLLEELGLPADMPANTSVNVAQNLMPIGIYAGGDEKYETLKEMLELDDSVTAETPLGEAVKNVKFGKYLEAFYGITSDEELNKYKEYYGLGDDVTADTLWGEVRDKVDAKTKEMYDAQRAAGTGK